MTITTNDNLQLHVQDFPVSNPKAVVAIVHGLGEHGGRYTHVAQYLNQQGYAVMTLDQRGHGLSSGKRGYTPSINTLLDDIDLFLAEAKMKYPAPAFLYGHSMGGCMVLSNFLERNPRIQGVIATGAFISLAFKPSPILLGLGRLMNKIYPAFTQHNQLNHAHVSSDTKVVDAYTSDPLVHDKLSSALGIGMLEYGEKLNNFKGNITTPLLLMHGTADKLTSPEGTKQLYNNTTGNRVLKLWDGLYHEIHNEPQQREVFAYLLSWLDSHL